MSNLTTFGEAVALLKELHFAGDDGELGKRVEAFLAIHSPHTWHSRKRQSEAEQRWIPLRERLPEGNGDVLAHHEALGPFGNGVVIRPAQVVRHWGIHKDDESMMGAFWMPLPAAPSRSEEKP